MQLTMWCSALKTIRELQFSLTRKLITAMQQFSHICENCDGNMLTVSLVGSESHIYIGNTLAVYFIHSWESKLQPKQWTLKNFPIKINMNKHKVV